MIAALALLALQRPAAAPDTGQGRPCTVAIDSVGRAYQSLSATGRQNVFGGGGVHAHCLGTETRVSSDSFAYFVDQRRADWIGHFHFRDTLVTLDANFASYYLQDERLEAHYQVHAVNHANGSTLDGPNLTYWREHPGIRDTTEMYATGRPVIHYLGAPDTAARADTEPYVIVADRVRFKGDDRMYAAGTVTVDRSDFAARGDSMRLDETAGLGVLLGKPTLQGKGEAAYTLRGTRIELGLAHREIDQVRALGAGEAEGTDWRLTADTIFLTVARRKLQRAFAWSRDTTLAYAVSATNTIRAESLAVDMPDQVLTEVRGFRKAFSTSKRDSTVAAADADWIAGDTLVAHWNQEPDSTGRPRAVLRTIVSRGGARAFTHLYPAKTDSVKAPSLNYTRGDTIRVTLRDAKIDRITAYHADGLQLDPAPPAPPDTTKGKAATPDSGAARPRRPPARGTR